MLKFALALAVLFSFTVHPDNGSCVDPDGSAGRCSQSTIGRGAGRVPVRTAADNTDKGLGVDPNG